MSGVIHLQTEIPGPNSRALLARRGKAVPRGVPAVTPIAVVHADGAVLTDADGNRLIDFGGGIGVVNTGHRHPGVVQAVRDQLDRFAHVCFPVSTYEPYVELAERLNRLTPGTHEKRTFFLNSGAEAVENAVKVARFFTGRQAVVCFEHGFHGRTNLAMALTSKVMPYKKGFGPFAPEVYRIPFPYCYRCGEAGRQAERGSRRAVLHGEPRAAGADLRQHGRPRLRRRHHHGARAGRRRLRPRAEGVRGRAGGVRPGPRHPLHRR